MSLRAQADTAAIAAVKAEAPESFRVGATFDGHVISGGASYNRKWSNGWGATAYLKAWWNDAAVLPQDKTGILIGAEGVYKFK